MTLLQNGNTVVVCTSKTFYLVQLTVFKSKNIGLFLLVDVRSWSE